MKKNKCKYCNTEILAKSMGAHVLSCKNNPKYIEFILKRKETKLLKRGQKQKDTLISKICPKCGITFNKNTKFCSRSCGNSHIFSLERKEKLKKAQNKNKKLFKCKYCHSEYFQIKKSRGFCSDKCSKNYYKEKKLIVKRSFRHQCRFKFDVFDYPNEFDLSLIEKFGFYRPINAKNGANLNGVSLDHILSISDASKNNIDPKIIGHPANCKLMIHNQNISKGKKSLITLSELEDRILIWNIKYKEYINE